MSHIGIRVHVSLDVQSIDRSIAFYSKLLGEHPSKAREGYSNFRLDSPPVHLALQEGRHASGGGVSHLGFELQDHEQLADWQKRLEVNGIKFETENDAKCCYAKADKLWVTDPDGYRWEVWVRTGEHEAMGQTSPQVKQSTASCC